MKRKPDVMLLVQTWKDDASLLVTAQDPKGNEVGRLNAKRADEGDFVRVITARTEAHARRQGVGTALYQEAARVACKDLGIPLGSGRNMSEEAQGFWAKQLKKGRATVRADGGYVLSCPAPRSLGRPAVSSLSPSVSSSIGCSRRIGCNKGGSVVVCASSLK